MSLVIRASESLPGPDRVNKYVRIMALTFNISCQYFSHFIITGLIFIKENKDCQDRSPEDISKRIRIIF